MNEEDVELSTHNNNPMDYLTPTRKADPYFRAEELESLVVDLEKRSAIVSPFNDNASVESLSPMKNGKYCSLKNKNALRILEVDIEEEDSSEDSEAIFQGKIAAISPLNNRQGWNEKSCLLDKKQENNLEDKCEDNSDCKDVYIQSLVLGIAFACIWLPQNVMAPNLTDIAHYFNFSDATRDVLLGANIAFATSVLSVPVGAVIGVLADVTSRKYLYALVVMIGGISSICSGLSRTYTQLYVCRFITGGCMTGATPVSFSLLGDFFSTKDRNAASSGLTAMMGLGIILGQVFAGMVGPTHGWRCPFHFAGALCILSSLLVLIYVDEPVRGGTEKALQDMMKRGMKYEKKLTWRGLLHALFLNPSNCLLTLQGFFASVPWGIIFIFLNDYLSQEQGLSVQDATFLVLIFGIGCAVGGLLGGWVGQKTTQMRREYMPLFMSFSTALGILPFYALLNDNTFHTANLKAVMYAFSGGCIASLPAVNVRPAIINVNPPEIRGATLTAATLIINIARGIGPSFLTTVCAVFNVSRSYSFNVLLIIFWLIAAIQLFILAFYLPHDQDRMEQELATYAASHEPTSYQNISHDQPSIDMSVFNDEDTVISIAERTISFDAEAARETWYFFNQSLRHMAQKEAKTSSTTTHHGNNTIVCSHYADATTDIDVIHNTNVNDR